MFSSAEAGPRVVSDPSLNGRPVAEDVPPRNDQGGACARRHKRLSKCGMRKEG